MATWDVLRQVPWCVAEILYAVPQSIAMSAGQAMGAAARGDLWTAACWVLIAALSPLIVPPLMIYGTLVVFGAHLRGECKREAIRQLGAFFGAA